MVVTNHLLRGMILQVTGLFRCTFITEGLPLAQLLPGKIPTVRQTPWKHCTRAVLSSLSRNKSSIPICSMYGIFTCIYHKHQPNVGKYTSPMDPMGYRNEFFFKFWFFETEGELAGWKFKIWCLWLYLIIIPKNPDPSRSNRIEGSNPIRKD